MSAVKYDILEKVGEGSFGLVILLLVSIKLSNKSNLEIKYRSIRLWSFTYICDRSGFNFRKRSESCRSLLKRLLCLSILLQCFSSCDQILVQCTKNNYLIMQRSLQGKDRRHRENSCDEKNYYEKWRRRG